MASRELTFEEYVNLLGERYSLLYHVYTENCLEGELISDILQIIDKARKEIDRLKNCDDGCAESDQAKHEIMYECDRRACDSCRIPCHRTADIRHAKNFEMCDDTFYENERFDD